MRTHLLWPHIVVEGLPCAGKTTLCARLKDQMGLALVPELAQFLGKEERFPGDGKTCEEVYRIADWFLKKETARYDRARMLLKRSPTVMDRSFFTILTYNYAYQLLNRITPYEKLNRTVEQYIADGTFITPQLLIMLSISPDVLRKRRAKRIYVSPESLPDFWLDDRFLYPLIDAYKYYFCQLAVPVLEIDGTLDRELIFECAASQIAGLLKKS
jgi:deoxyadenosine/deoxycytidine kinase